jgi:hypothetical protein
MDVDLIDDIQELQEPFGPVQARFWTIRQEKSLYVLPLYALSCILFIFCSLVWFKYRLESFFAHTHSSIRIFDQETFMYNYELGIIDNFLLQTMLAMTSLHFKKDGDTKERSQAQQLLRSNRILIFKNEENSKLTPSVEHFQHACLLAYYNFHQHPGQESWLMIGTLSRRAYQIGLHQLDNFDQPPSLLFMCINENEKEAWRRIWWFIYALDSYSNITAGTPFLLERESTRTALPMPISIFDLEATHSLLFLDEPEVLWKTVREIFSRNIEVNHNLHIVTTTILNEAATLQRLLKQNPTAKLRTRLSTLEDHLSAIRLALAPRYLEPARNVIQDESSADYHARMICVLHLHVSRVLLTMPIHAAQSDGDRQSQWQRTREYCSDIVAVIRQWDSTHSLSVDPAICLIVFAALSLLNLHSRYSPLVGSIASERLELDKTVLLLFLEQFGYYWELPKHLIGMWSQSLTSMTGF